jgi:hypothetical protein
VRASTRGPYTPTGVRETSGAIAPAAENEPAAIGRSGPLSHVRALLIYLKHRGVLNIEEFRRTNGRGL